jgi:hypothetical protein
MKKLLLPLILLCGCVSPGVREVRPFPRFQADTVMVYEYRDGKVVNVHYLYGNYGDYAVETPCGLEIYDGWRPGQIKLIRNPYDIALWGNAPNFPYVPGTE